MTNYDTILHARLRLIRALMARAGQATMDVPAELPAFRGAMQRAVNAGLLGRAVAKQLAQAAKRLTPAEPDNP
jgi:hypothetical protein